MKINLANGTQFSMRQIEACHFDTLKASESTSWQATLATTTAVDVLLLVLTMAKNEKRKKKKLNCAFVSIPDEKLLAQKMTFHI